MIKRMTAILCAAAMMVSLTACSEKSADYGGRTVTGQVTAVDGSQVTLQIGELSEPERNTQNEMPQPAQSGNSQTPPDKPDGGMPQGGQTPPDSLSDNGQPPLEQPDGEKPQGNQAQPGSLSANGQAPPDKPDDKNSDGMPSDENRMPSDGNMPASNFTAGEESITVDLDGAAIQIERGMEILDGTMEDITENAILVVELDEKNAVKSVMVKAAGGMGMPGSGFGGSGEVTQGTAAHTLSANGEYSEEIYSSFSDDENALRVDNAAVTLSGITVDKSAGATSNTEDGDFYGMNAALLATNGAEVTIQDSTISSSAQNGNGVFSYGSGTTVNISDSEITTTADNSGGIQTTGGGTTNAANLTIETSGNSSAAIRSDRGGGTVQADGGSYTTNGYNSPAVYSTAAITVKNAALTANHSEALVIEGKNSIALENCTVNGAMSDTQGSSSDENVHNVMIYQSMSGDADVGTSEFSMTGGTLTSNNGDMIYVTNTHSIIKLSGVELANEDTEGYLLNITGNSASRGWGTAGKNGGQVEFTASGQVLEGDIVVDSISTLDLRLTEHSDFTGTINIVENVQGGTAVSDNAAVTVEDGSTWTLTGDCTITSLENNGTIHFNGYAITLADGTVLKQ